MYRPCVSCQLVHLIAPQCPGHVRGLFQLVLADAFSEGWSSPQPGWGYVLNTLSPLLILVKSHICSQDLAAASVLRLPVLDAKWHLNRNLIATGYSVFPSSNQLPLGPCSRRHKAHIFLAPIEVVVFGGFFIQTLFQYLPSPNPSSFPNLIWISCRILMNFSQTLLNNCIVFFLAYYEWVQLRGYLVIHLSHWRHFVEVSSMWTHCFFI